MSIPNVSVVCPYCDMSIWGSDDEDARDMLRIHVKYDHNGEDIE